MPKTHQLIEQAKRRDSEVIAELYRQYAHRIARYIGYRVPDSMVVEDLTASVFLIMVEKLPRYQDTGAPFEAWLYRIASTQIADYYRARKKYPQEALTETHPNRQAPVEVLVQDREHQRQLQMALNQLSEEDAEVYALVIVSLNGRPPAPLIDPTVNLADRERRFLQTASWILPLPENEWTG